MGKFVTRMFVSYAKWASQKPFIPLGLICLVAILSAWATTMLNLNANFEALLPEDTASVRARQEARERIGASDLYLIAINSPNPEENYRFAQKVAEKVATWSETKWVMDHVDLAIFRDRALLFMGLDDLTEMVDLVELQVTRGLCEVQNNCNERDLRTEKERESDENRLRELGNFYTKQIEETAGDRQELSKRYPELRDALMTQDGETAVVIAKLEKGSTDIEFAREVMLRGNKLVEDLDPSSYSPHMVAHVAGAYKSSEEYETVLGDAFWASMISLGFVILVVTLFFRQIKAVFLVATSLIVGILWTMGYTAFTYPVLNTITSVIFGILLGMGIDYSIHLCIAVRAARSSDTPLSEAFGIAVNEVTPAMLTSVLTTAAALLTLTVAHNRGFSEFGFIGAGGVFFCFLSAELTIPPVWGLIERMKSDVRPLTVPRDTWMARKGFLIAVTLFIVLSGAFAWRAPSLSFEYNLSNLRKPPSPKKRGISYGSAIRTGGGTTPAVLLGSSEEQLRKAHRFLSKRQEEGDTRLRDVVTIETFLPSEQEEKLEEIARLRDLLKPRTIKRVSKKYQADLESLARRAKVDNPLTFEELPGWVQRTIQENDGSVGKIGFLYLSGGHNDARDSRAFQNEYGEINVNGESAVRVACSPFVIADVVFTMLDDGKRMVILAFLAVIVLLLIDLRSIVGTIACSFSLALGLIWAFGAAEFLGIKLGVFNMLVIPVALGLGIDGSIHIYHRFKRDPEGFLKSPLGATGFAVFASSITTLAGFSGLLAVSHRGLKTIGQLALLTVGFTLIAVIGILPGILLKVVKKRSQ